MPVKGREGEDAENPGELPVHIGLWIFYMDGRSGGRGEGRFYMAGSSGHMHGAPSSSLRSLSI